MLKEKIKSEIITSIKKHNNDRRDALKVILGEFERQSKKELTETEEINIIKKLIKNEEEVLKQINSPYDSLFLMTLKEFLPHQLEEKQIIEWIKENIDFSKYKNKMQSMKDIISHFGTSVNGNIVKKIIENNF